VPLFKARVYVALKKGVLDPQGKAIGKVIADLGYQGVREVRQGKFFELLLDLADKEKAEQLVAELSDKVLRNPVIESVHFEISEGEG